MSDALYSALGGGVLVLLGIRALIVPGRLRQRALGYYSGKSAVGKLFRAWPGVHWISTHEKSHMVGIRVGGLVAIAIGVLLLYVSFFH